METVFAICLFLTYFSSFCSNLGVDLSSLRNDDSEWKTTLDSFENLGMPIKFGIVKVFNVDGTVDPSGPLTLSTAWKHGVQDLSIYMLPCLDSSPFAIMNNIHCGTAEEQLTKISASLATQNISSQFYFHSLPTHYPTTFPTTRPTPNPTTSPTTHPTFFPTTSPTTIPTPIPSTLPTARPTAGPTTKPTPSPSTPPTTYPSPKPSPTSMLPHPEPTLFHGNQALMRKLLDNEEEFRREEERMERRAEEETEEGRIGESLGERIEERWMEGTETSEHQHQQQQQQREEEGTREENGEEVADIVEVEVEVDPWFMDSSFSSRPSSDFYPPPSSTTASSTSSFPSISSSSFSSPPRSSSFSIPSSLSHHRRFSSLSSSSLSSSSLSSSQSSSHSSSMSLSWTGSDPGEYPTQGHVQSLPVQRLFIIVEDDYPPRYFSPSPLVNLHYLSSVVRAAALFNFKSGIYTSKKDWDRVTGGGGAGGEGQVERGGNGNTTSPFSRLPLWTPRYDKSTTLTTLSRSTTTTTSNNNNNNSSSLLHTLSTHFHSFGGWTHPYIKQIEGEAKEARRRNGGSRKINLNVKAEINVTAHPMYSLPVS